MGAFDNLTPHTIWVCIDCYVAHHGLTEEGDPSHVPDREPLSLIDEGCVEVTAGLLYEEHDEDCEVRQTAESGGPVYDSQECECERQTFSWSWCEGCGSQLGGAREALTIWTKEVAA